MTEVTVVVEEEKLKADKRYSSRKWLFSLVIWAVGTIVWVLALLIDWLPDCPTELWIDFSKWVLGLYMAGNVGDTAAEKLFSVFSPATVQGR